ncbi:SDR family oxidoreductase [Azomonas macrocytogenes]|uniref:3-oxoacyl-[acyl-carrier protein] reductase n=1 Tax=Azomonas macrocytogenes TaxID=69962 RepID=A0A839T1F1_AZOMA|nr:SDR family oxidoreductase [Azomonas macrocytogenes]MBB3103222.1 3-oxoacyl-[acyl-carrier protein] reductase [Azomonas macrocytogenes]
MNTASKTAIVTGGSRGIGQAIAKRLAADGFAVVVGYAGNAARAQETVSTIRAQGGTAIATQADISDPEQVAALYESAQEAFSRIDVVVNNAGVMPVAPIALESLPELYQAVATNLHGTFLMMAHAARHLGEGGRFIALSSSVLAKNFPGYGPYIASKAGVEGLVHVFANELRGRGITVNAVAPGPVATELFRQGKSEEQIAQIVKQAPLERIGQPDDIASVVAFLAGSDGAWVNSQVLRANGGFA